MMAHHIFKILVMLFCIISISCSAENSNHVIADVCVAVSMNNGETGNLIEKIDIFGKSHNLDTNKSHPISYEYKDKANQAILSVITHFGPHGIIVSFYRFDKKKGEVLQADLERFIWDDIASIYEVKACGDIEGFRPPQMWN